MSDNLNNLLSIIEASGELAVLLQLVLAAGTESELDPVEESVVRILGPKKISIKMMVEYLQENNSTMTGIMDRLEKKGVIVREINPSDRRVVLVCLTKKWRRKYNDIVKRQERAAKRICEALDQEKIDSLLALILETNHYLSKTLGLVQKQPIFAKSYADSETTVVSKL